MARAARLSGQIEEEEQELEELMQERTKLVRSPPGLHSNNKKTSVRPKSSKTRTQRFIKNVRVKQSMNRYTVNQSFI